MSPTMIIGLLTFGSGLLLCLLCLPLIYRKVPMNGAYGIRIPASFRSNEHWYEINAYGGRCLAAWSGLIIAAGAAGPFVPRDYHETYLMINAAVALLAVAIATFQTIWWSRKRFPTAPAVKS